MFSESLIIQYWKTTSHLKTSNGLCNSLLAESANRLDPYRRSS